MPDWIACGSSVIQGPHPTPKVMGIVNVTPDSFSDGGRNSSTDDAVRHAFELVHQGAEILDIGGESSRPGADVVPVEAELRRVIPVIRELRGQTSAPISIDTTKAEVARQALEAGATIVNDISALMADPRLGSIAAEHGAGIILMHMQGTPQTMQLDPRYDDLLTEVYDFLARRVEHAESLGIAHSSIAIDPGIGFGKTVQHNLDLLRGLPRFAGLGCAIVIGVSRKGFLKNLTGRSMAERTTSSVVCSLAACQAGANVARVHDVGPMADAIKVWTALRGWETSR